MGVAVLERQCELGNPRGCLSLALLHEAKRLASPDVDKAKAYRERARTLRDGD